MSHLKHIFRYRDKSFVFPDAREDYISRVVRETDEFYEQALLEHLESTAPHGGLIIDVGANIGNHSVFFAEFMKSAVLAVEPLPRNVEMLHWMVKENDLRDKIFPIPLAAGPRSGWAALTPLETDHADPYGSLAVTKELGDDSISVPVDTVDSMASRFAGEVENISLIKIDVEGYEWGVLDGAEGVIGAFRPHLAIEIAEEAEYKEIHARLIKFNYRQVGKFNATPTYHFAPN